jgi:hypothetical protein
MLGANMSDDLFTANVVATAATLDEIARAINELGFRREANELTWPHLEPEHKTLRRLIQQRAELGRFSYEDMFDFAALLILEGMIAQNLCDLRLAAQLQPPFTIAHGAGDERA